MHLVLAFTMMHDRLLQSTRESNPVSTTEMFHYHNGTAIFNQRLQDSEATSSERDAIYVASMMISVQYVGYVDATSPEHAWPLRSLGPGEPDWLELSLGKRKIEGFCDPLRADSCFQKMLVEFEASTDQDDFTPHELRDGGFHHLPGEMLEFLALTDPSTWSSSPYFHAANIVSQLLRHEYNESNFVKFLTFMYLMEAGFRALWRDKDPGALLLIVYWYSMAIVPSKHWWMWYVAVLLLCRSLAPKALESISASRVQVTVAGACR